MGVFRDGLLSFVLCGIGTEREETVGWQGGLSYGVSRSEGSWFSVWIVE